MRDTTIIERNLSTGKRRTFSMAPYCIVIIILALLGAMLVILGTTDRVKQTSVLKSKYSAILPEATLPAPKRHVPVTFQHVIFHVGAWEVFRFTYEEANGVREGGYE